MNQRIKLTKRLLQESLLGLLDSRSVEEVSIVELCRDAGINRSTFYAHYSCIRDVVRDISGGLTDRIREICRREQEDRRACLEEICRCLYENRDTVLKLMRSQTEEELEETFAALDGDFYLFRSLGTEPRDDKLVLAFVNHGAYNLVKTWLAEEEDRPPKDTANLIYDRLFKKLL